MNAERLPRATNTKKDKIGGGEEDEEDHLWSLHTPEYIEDQGDHWLSKDFPTRELLLPTLLLCQIAISLINVICSLAILKIEFRYPRESNELASWCWLIISFINVILPILLLALIRMESPLIMGLFCGANCVTFVLLSISVIHEFFPLFNYSSDKKKDGRYPTIYVILLGIIVRTINVVVTGIAVYVIYEYTLMLDSSERRRLRKKKKVRTGLNKIVVENPSMENLSS